MLTPSRSVRFPKSCRGIALILSAALIACAASAGDDFGFLVPVDATAIRRDAHTPSSYQLTFQARRDYPAKAIDADALLRLERRGWTQCRPDLSSWDSFYDAAQKRVLHQASWNWRRGTQLLTMHLRYSSPAESTKRLPSPSTDVQYIIILVNEYGKQIDAAIRKLDLTC
jgi:hypothetical protein